MTRELLFTLPIGVTRLEERWKADGEFKVTPEGTNAPDLVQDVPVYLDPTLGFPGVTLTERDSADQISQQVIVLRQWNLAVLVHEITHVAIDHITQTGMTFLMSDAQGHSLVNPIEIAIAPLIHRLAAEDVARSGVSA